jgi:hypothetical protein
MRRAIILLVAAVFVVAIAGCGGDDEAASDTDTTALTETTTDETATDETATEETTTEETDTGDLGDFASGECLELAQAGQALGAALGATGTGDDLSAQSEAFQDFVDKAPEEIRADVQILADAFAKYADALGDIDIEPGETPSQEQALKLAQALGSLDQAEVTAASERVTAWTTENCSSG